MSENLPKSTEHHDLIALQAAIDQSIIRRAAELSMAEKLRMGADLYDEGIRWLRQLIKAENPEFSDEQISQELDRRRAIARRIDDAGRFRPYNEDGSN